MGFVKRVCQICGHDTTSMVACGRVDSDGVTPCGKADDAGVPLRTAIHDHCKHETCGEPDQHGFCTQVGCMATAQPLGLVNPEIG
jgi:hypothetical protein